MSLCRPLTCTNTSRTTGERNSLKLFDLIIKYPIKVPDLEPVCEDEDNKLEVVSGDEGFLVEDLLSTPDLIQQSVADEARRASEARVQVERHVGARRYTAATGQVHLEPETHNNNNNNTITQVRSTWGLHYRAGSSLSGLTSGNTLGFPSYDAGSLFSGLDLHLC